MQIEEIRSRIDEIDSEMAELFVRRMEVVREVAAYKSERGLPIEDRAREQSLIASKSAMVEDEEIRLLYVDFQQELMEISKRLQYRMINGLRVSCAGKRYSAEYSAAAELFSDENIVPVDGFEEAYRAAETGECDVAVLPLENSYKGEIGQVYDLIFSGNLFINAIHAVSSGGSTTRYAVLSRIENELSAEPSGKNEAFLIMFTVRDEVGGLAKAINIISAYDFNMRVMRSRPMKGLPWHYYFYAELAGDCSIGNAKRISRALATACPVVKIVGHFAEDPDDPATMV